MMSSIQHESTIVLPPIHEMFPEYIPKSKSGNNSSWCPSKPGLKLSEFECVGPGSLSMPYRPRSHSATSNPRSWRQHPQHLEHTLVRPVKAESPIFPPAAPFIRGHSETTMYQQQQRHPTSPGYSFGVLRSDPSSSSLQHITSSASFQNRSNASGCSLQGEISNRSAPVFKVFVPEHLVDSRGVGQAHTHRSDSSPTSAPQNSEPECAPTISTGPGYSAIFSFPVSGPAVCTQAGRDRSPDDPEAASDGDLSGSNNGKKHVCPTCLKRFNRPSSLRIHVNTHTGATPFRCPWPDCAREFNVNSNMRRHYRNHTTPGSSRPQVNDPRRRRKRGSPPALVFVPNGSRSKAHKRANSSANPPISSLSISEDEDDISDSATGHLQDDEEDELESLADDASPVPEASLSPRSNMSPDDPQNPFARYSQSHLRSDASVSSSHSLPSSPPQDHIYSPSAPYSRSIADPKVSTALRPAFHSISRQDEPMGEPMSDR